MPCSNQPNTSFQIWKARLLPAVSAVLGLHPANESLVDGGGIGAGERLNESAVELPTRDAAALQGVG
jgi:hypothetical protein